MSVEHKWAFIQGRDMRIHRDWDMNSLTTLWIKSFLHYIFIMTWWCGLIFHCNIKPCSSVETTRPWLTVKRTEMCVLSSETVKRSEIIKRIRKRFIIESLISFSSDLKRYWRLHMFDILNCFHIFQRYNMIISFIMVKNFHSLRRQVFLAMLSNVVLI